MKKDLSLFLSFVKSCTLVWNYSWVFNLTRKARFNLKKLPLVLRKKWDEKPSHIHVFYDDCGKFRISCQYGEERGGKEEMEAS